MIGTRIGDDQPRHSRRPKCFTDLHFFSFVVKQISHALNEQLSFVDGIKLGVLVTFEDTQ